ncbi:hypothetical protein GVAV_000663 [Gurleya vavrai]
MRNEGSSSFLRKFISLISIVLYYIFRKKEEPGLELEIPKGKKYDVIQLNLKNYKRLSNENFLVFVTFENKKLDRSFCKKVNKHFNLAVLNVKTLFDTKLALIFKPKQLTEFFYIRNGFNLTRKENLNFNKKCNFSEVLSLFFYVKIQKVLFFMELFGFDYAIDCLMLYLNFCYKFGISLIK